MSSSGEPDGTGFSCGIGVSSCPVCGRVEGHAPNCPEDDGCFT